MKIIIINGPNLNLLGKREPTIYGNETFEMYFDTLKQKFQRLELHYFQSNIEGEIIDKLHEVGFDFDGIIFNQISKVKLLINSMKLVLILMALF